MFINHAKAVSKQFLKFGLVGVANTLISYFVYVALTYLGLYYLLSNVIAFVVSMINAFYWNNKHVFKENRENRKAVNSAFYMVISYAFSGLAVGSALLYVLVDVLGISKYIAPFFGLCITVPLNFVLNKFWVFR
ncbi:MAG: GtrA family protein [Fibromonadales bacterium]|nr:GtrA family protein [Fibromonadales bacterium]